MFGIEETYSVSIRNSMKFFGFTPTKILLIMLPLKPFGVCSDLFIETTLYKIRACNYNRKTDTIGKSLKLRTNFI